MRKSAGLLWLLVGLEIVASFVGGLADAASSTTRAAGAPVAKKNVRVIYPKRTELDFEGIRLEGELRNPGEFYFKYRPEEKFDSLVKRRKNFHREMLRDVVLTK